MISRRNYGRGHAYADEQGRVPGVTSILSAGLPKPALVNWAANVTAEYAVDHWAELAEQGPAARLKTLTKARYADRDAAANRGTQVHGLAERLIIGEQVDVPDELAGHVESYLRFLDEWEPAPVIVEGVVISRRHRYAGTFDLIADIAGERWLLDLKTSRSGIFGEVALQLAAYRYADAVLVGDTEQPVPEVDRTGAVHVRADGYDLIPVTAGPAEFRAFRYVQQVAGFAESARELVGDALTPPRLEATA